ncbi:hypothetical protein SAY87_019397 [Trapa incisa]|uniref:RING-type domain-containing protein n=1 Tax=Trapa incisa TaxID=236973 RepID=A0AAN7K1K8_9MYRT|nr:hypothetical protein SAY87_019397 [Trapa incisa]
MSSLLSGRPRREGIEQMWERNRSPCKSSFRESIKALEADIQHANSLASALPRNYCGGDTIQMRLCYSPFAPLFMFFMEWMDYSCTDIVPSYLGLLHILVYADGVPALCSKERKASLREFYAVIYPSLRILEGQISEIKETKMKSRCRGLEAERDEECGICMESQAKMVLPSCGHSMCINCFHDWNVRSQSCPYCRGSLKRVSSTDLWVLTGTSEVVDPETLAMDSLTRFYLYIESLPSLTHDTHVLLLDYMI